MSRLQNIFNKFEPEVSEEHIASRWEELKKHLPSERRTGTVFWLNQNGHKLARLAAFLIVALGFYLFTDLNPESETIQTSLPQSKSEIKTPVAKKNIPGTQDKNPINQTISPPVYANNPPGNSQVLHPGKQSLHIKPTPPSKTTQKEILQADQQETGKSSAESGGISDHLVQSDLLPSKNLLNIYRPAPTVESGKILPTPSPLPLARRVTFDVFGGLTSYLHSSDESAKMAGGIPFYSQENTEEIKSGNSVTGGLGIRITTWRQWFIPVQVQYMSRQEIFQGAEQREIISNSLTSAFTTGHKYSRAYWRAGTGIGYRFYRTRTFNASIFLMAELVQADYLYEGYTSVQVGRIQLSNPYTGSSTVIQLFPFSMSERKRHGAVAANLLLSKQVTSRISATMRVSFHRDIKKRDLEGIKTFGLQSKQISLSIGVACNLKPRYITLNPKTHD